MITDDDYYPLPCPGLEADWNGVCDHCGVHADHHTAANDSNFDTLLVVIENSSHLPQADGRPEVSNTGLLSHFETETP